MPLIRLPMQDPSSIKLEREQHKQGTQLKSKYRTEDNGEQRRVTSTRPTGRGSKRKESNVVPL